MTWIHPSISDNQLKSPTVVGAALLDVMKAIKNPLAVITAKAPVP